VTFTRGDAAGAAPAELCTPHFRLQPLRVSDVERDYDAVMSSRAALRLWSQSTWPAEDFTLAENRVDLERHDGEHVRGEAYTYTVLAPHSERCLGCVYIAPLRPEEEALLGDAAGERRARVTFWVRDAELAHDLDRRLFEALHEWFDAAWEFDGVVFATAHDEVRQQQLFRDVGLADRGSCTLANGRVVRLFVAPAALRRAGA
jgi:hypothetical protein